MTKETNSREIVLDILLEVLEQGALSHVILKQALEKYQYLEKQERAFITRVTEGTIERLLYLDAALNQVSKVKVKKMKPVIRTLLRMSAYQILFLERVPDSAVCNEAVKLAKKRKFDGLSGFVNGVLRSLSREKEKLCLDTAELCYSMPQWILSMWEKDYGRECAQSMAAALLEERPLSVRCNLSRKSKEAILQSLRKQEILIEQSPVCDSVFHISGYDYLDQVEAFRNGWITVQDASSAMVGVIGAKDLLKNTPGLVILDVCSAPGGKAMHLADLAALHDAAGRGGLKSRIEARDLTDYKVSLIEENLARCGFSNVETRVWDAAVFDPYMEERADLVLADLPCSGLGIIGKKPDIKFRLKEEEIPALAALQREILAVTARYVRPGGTLIFSTCTVNKTENDRNADWILKHLPFKKKDITACLPKGLRTMMKEGWENQIQIFPGKAPCDGFFIAAFERI